MRYRKGFVELRIVTASTTAGTAGLSAAGLSAAIVSVARLSPSAAPAPRRRRPSACRRRSRHSPSASPLTPTPRSTTPAAPSSWSDRRRSKASGVGPRRPVAGPSVHTNCGIARRTGVTSYRWPSIHVSTRDSGATSRRRPRPGWRPCRLPTCRSRLATPGSGRRRRNARKAPFARQSALDGPPNLGRNRRDRPGRDVVAIRTPASSAAVSAPDPSAAGLRASSPGRFDRLHVAPSKVYWYDGQRPAAATASVADIPGLNRAGRPPTAGQRPPADNTARRSSISTRPPVAVRQERAGGCQRFVIRAGPQRLTLERRPGLLIPAGVVKELPHQGHRAHRRGGVARSVRTLRLQGHLQRHPIAHQPPREVSVGRRHQGRGPADDLPARHGQANRDALAAEFLVQLFVGFQQPLGPQLRQNLRVPIRRALDGLRRHVHGRTSVDETGVDRPALAVPAADVGRADWLAAMITPSRITNLPFSTTRPAITSRAFTSRVSLRVLSRKPGGARSVAHGHGLRTAEDRQQRRHEGDARPAEVRRPAGDPTAPTTIARDTELAGSKRMRFNGRGSEAGKPRQAAGGRTLF